MTARHYLDTRRRMLLDMHIPDWDPGFLAEYDPAALADLYASAGVTGVLFYCKSHLGLNYWPAPVGAIHPVAAGRDLVGELYAALRERGIAPAAYHTTIFDNWAIEQHPEWSVVPISTRAGVDAPWHGPRYGTACPNHPGYREYERAQITALLARYDFDALWLDMTFWNAVCVCDTCTARFRAETALEIPVELDWTAPAWAAFQSARERWLEEFIAELYDAARSVRPTIALTHNFGAATHGWYSGLRTDASMLDTFAAGDIYGGRDEQLVISKLMQHLGQRQPAEFMTTRTPDLANHVELKSEHAMAVEALATLAHDGAFLFIDAIDPRGTVNPGVYERVGRVFEQMSRWEPELGGSPVADVAIYRSDAAAVFPADSGVDAAAATIVEGDATRKHDLPHLRAVTAASAALQRAHVPFTIFTRASLDRLAQVRVLVLPDVIRMDEAERAAVRRFVSAGGRVYASGRTSLLDTAGTEPDGLALGDLFGVRLIGHEDGDGFYLKAVSALVADAVAPERYLGHGFRDGWVGRGYHDRRLGLPRVEPVTGSETLATLSLPYAYPSPGSMRGHDFASIHSSPPWEDTSHPAVVSHSSGHGRTIYSVAPIERGTSGPERRMFVALVEELLAGPATFGSDAHPDVWMSAFEQAERSRILVCALVYRTDAPPTPVPFGFRYRVPAGSRVERVTRVSSGSAVPFRVMGDTIEVAESSLELFDMFAVDLADS
jgi:hypothetical protein